MLKRCVALVLIVLVVTTTLALPASAEARTPSRCSMCDGRRLTLLSNDYINRTEYTRNGCTNTTVTHTHYIDYYYHCYICKDCGFETREYYKSRELCSVGNFRAIVK